MLNLNECTNTKPKPKPKLIFKNCSFVCAYHCAQLSYTTEHRSLKIFSLILQTIIIAQMMCTGEKGGATCIMQLCGNTITVVRKTNPKPQNLISQL